jgi:uncharacterized 2Fe-2S/4Fe-4S cluster protein (DUF4445 family)
MKISEYLRQQQVLLDMPCGGHGICQNCKVTVWKEGELRADAKEVLACQTEYQEGMTILYQGKEIKNGDNLMQGFPLPNHISGKEEGPQLIAVDLGSTTIAVKNMANGECAVSENHQRAYGHDIVSRIEAAISGQEYVLHDLAWEDLYNLFRRVDFDGNGQVIIAGNTTMQHFLEGVDVKGLSHAPFDAGDISFHKMEESDFYLMPGFSAFVGGDIVSGIYALDMDQSEEYNLLLDLGTNGEMVLGNKDGFYITSTAAGPALEGGNIAEGMAGIPGAIYDVEIKKGFSRAKVIDNRLATGICGAGVIATCAELLRDGCMNSHGILNEEYREEGFPVYSLNEKYVIRLTQDDIRQVQLAKAAIRAGIQVLMDEAKIEWSQISHVYLAGGLGYALNPEHAVEIGMIPEVLLDRVEAVGNTSLLGVTKCISKWQKEGGSIEDCAAIHRIEKIPAMGREILLSNHEDFSMYYLSYLDF